MASEFSPPYDIAVHPRYRDEPFDELPKWLRNRIERYSVPTEDIEDDDVPEDDDAPEVEVDESGDPMPTGVTFPHHKGGGYYVLSDGTVLRGRDEAAEAEAQLQG